MPVRNVVAYLAVLLIFASPDHTRRLNAQQGQVPATWTENGAQASDGKRFEVKFEMAPLTRAKVLESGLRLLAPLSLPKGRYQLRVAIGDEALTGSVVYDLEVPDFEARFVMSGLLVGSEQSTAIVTATPGNTGRIPGGTVLTPTTRRDFSRQDVVRIYTELYDDKASPTDFASHAELRDATGNVVLMKPLERVPGESGMLEGYRMQVNLPLAGVPPGTYALQVHGRSGDDKDRRGTRSLLIRVK